MTDVRQLILSAIPAFTSTVLAVPDDAWDNPTPCEDWTVRDLVNHMTSEHLWAPRILHGETIEEVGSAYDGDVLGDDPTEAWRTAARASAEAWAYTDLGVKVHLSYGLIPAGDYAEQVLVDLAVHRWDLQRGANVGEAMDGAVVLHVLDYVRDQADSYGASGLFDPPVPTESEYAHDQLIALAGRDPFWRSPAR
ncbi:MAG: TIGR03086 family metal-binding protein [Actinomycetota bacterium]|nr:TIGR03086 family metal-binding protein [Actinomycetota bacterium]